MAERTPLEQMWQRAIDVNVRYWETVGRATTDYMQQITRLWADAPISWSPGPRSPGMRPASEGSTAAGRPSAGPVLLLEGPAGSTAEAVVMISNDLDRRTEAEVDVSKLRGPDGRFVGVSLRPEPALVELDRGERTSVTVRVDITDDLDIGVDYRGEVNVPGLSQRGVPLVVRRTD